MYEFILQNNFGEINLRCRTLQSILLWGVRVTILFCILLNLLFSNFHEYHGCYFEKLFFRKIRDYIYTKFIFLWVEVTLELHNQTNSAFNL